MILEIYERLALLDLLPKEEKYAGMKEIRRAREIFSLTPEEIKSLSYEEIPEGNRLRVKLDVAKAVAMAKDLPVSEWVTQKIRTLLSELENKGKLNDQTYSLYEKFVVTYR